MEEKKKVFKQMKPVSTGTRMMWREKYGEGGKQLILKHATASAKHGGGNTMARACVAASGTGLFFLAIAFYLFIFTHI